MQAQQSLYLCGVPENLNLSGLDLRSAYNSEPASDISLQSNLDLSSVDWESTHAVSRGKPSVAKSVQAHASVIYRQCPSLPTARLNK